MRSAPPRPWLRLLILGALPLAAVAACGSDGDEQEGADAPVTTEDEAPEVFRSCGSVTEPEGGPQNLGAVINMIDFEYCQDDVTVEVGQAIEFVNNGQVRHQVEQVTTGDEDAAFRSTTLASGEEYVFTPPEAGTYNYICVFHPEQMSGVITAQ